MPKVVGIDFSSLKQCRTAVKVKMPDGNDYELPLIKVRDAGLAETLISRNDTLAVRYNTIQAHLKLKSASIGAMVDAMSAEQDTTIEEKSLRGMETIDSSMELIYDMQKKSADLIKESNVLYDEIIEFITPYLEGTAILKQLADLDPVYTLKILNLMLYGEECLTSKDDEGETKENPTTTPLPSN